jgi:hypothetical protein
MTLAFILGLSVLLGTSSPTCSCFVETQTSPATPAANSQRTAAKPQEPSPKDTQPEDKGEQQPPPAESRPQEPGETRPQVQPPQEPPPQPAPPAQANPAPTPQAVPKKPAPEVKPSAESPAQKAKRKKAGTRKDPPPANSEPRKIVVRDGGVPEPTGQLTPGMSRDQASRSRQTISQLLASTEENLKRTSGRSLNPNEKATVDQIRSFVTQANAALKAGDLQRGHNLAMKAHLLSDDLVRH